MSDSIPIIIHVIPKEEITNVFGNELGELLSCHESTTKANVKTYPQTPKPINPAVKSLVVFSRGRMIVFALGNLINKSGFKSLNFIGDQTYTHNIIIDSAWGTETHKYTVIKEHMDLIVKDIHLFIDWCKNNPDTTSEEFWGNYGSNIDARDFDNIRDVINHVPISLKPNDNICDSDSWDAALAFSLLKTTIELLDYANTNKYWVICEHYEMSA